MRQQFVLGNWKMNGSLHSIRILLDELLMQLPAVLSTLQAAKGGPEIVVFPPAIYLPEVAERLQGSPIQWGAQNIAFAEKGAYTGELSAAMLEDYGCRYVLIGHSERRILFHEDEKCVAKKFHRVKEHGMIPVLCVGETALAREEGMTMAVLEKQLGAVVEEGTPHFEGSVIAYEPVWAIGTGQTATPEAAAQVQANIRAFIADFSPEYAKMCPIVYGGSVTEMTAGALFAMPEIDGGLVGGASLNAKQFLDIVTCIKSF